MDQTNCAFGSLRSQSSSAVESAETLNSPRSPSLLGQLGNGFNCYDIESDNQSDNSDGDGDISEIDDEDMITTWQAEFRQRADDQRQREILLSPQACRNALNFQCQCSMPCVLRCGINTDQVFVLRSELLKVPNNGRRLVELAKTVRTMRTQTATAHPAESVKGKRKALCRATKQHFVLNQMDVCADFYAHVVDTTQS